jgi:large repetitive protein
MKANYINGVTGPGAAGRAVGTAYETLTGRSAGFQTGLTCARPGKDTNGECRRAKPVWKPALRPRECVLFVLMLLFYCAATQAQTYSLGWGYVGSGGGQGTAGSLTESGSIGLGGVSIWTSPLIYFTSQPQSVTTVAGTTVAFTVAVAGTPPISYQWRRNGTNLIDGGNISGATTAALTLNNVQVPDGGSLDAVVWNSDGSITSSAATLTVNVTGAGFRFGTSINGGIGIENKSSSGIALTNVTLALPSTIFFDSASAPPGTGFTPFSVASIVGSMAVALPDDLVTDGHSTAQFGFSGFDPGEGVRIACDYDSFATPDDAGDPLGGAVTVFFDNGTSLNGILTGSPATVAGQPFDRSFLIPLSTPPTITTEPADQVVGVNSNATFSVIGSAGMPPFGYQWFFNDVGIGGATNSFLALTNVMLAAQGNYQVVITNAFGSVTSRVATLTVLCPVFSFSPGTLPAATRGVPFSQGISVSYSGQGPSDTILYGLAGGSLPAGLFIAADGTVSGIPTAAGSFNFTVAATNQFGCTGSRAYSLSVYVPPGVNPPPATSLVFGGSGFTLTMSATGSEPLAYQWRLNGNSIFGANSSTFVVVHGTVTNAGNYDVVISNPYGSITSGVVAASFFGDLKFYAGTTLAGIVGANYRVEYADVIGGVTNAWQTLTTLTLPYSPYLVIDPTSPLRNQRFYRAWPVP